MPGRIFSRRQPGKVDDLAQRPFFNEYSTRFGVGQSVQGGISDHNFDGLNPFSVSVWTKTDTLTGFHSILGNLGPALIYEGWELLLAGNTLVVFIIDTFTGNNYIDVRSAGLFSLSTWQHITVTYDGSQSASGVTIYRNGASFASVVFRDTLTNTIVSPAAFTIGGRPPGPPNWVGNIDEISLWDVELSAAEVTEIYNSGSPSYLFEHSEAANLRSWYSMGDLDTFPIAQNRVTTAPDLTMLGMTAANFELDVP